MMQADMLVMITVFVMAIVVAIAAFLALRLRQNRGGDPMILLAEALGAQGGGKSITGTLDGVAYRLDVGMRSRSGSFAMLAVNAKGISSMAFRKPNGMDQWGRKLGLMAKAESGDPAFDEEIVVTFQNQEQAAQFLADAGRRKTIMHLMDLFPGLISLNNEVAAFHFPGKELNAKVVTDLPLEKIRSAISLLYELGGHGASQDVQAVPPASVPINAAFLIPRRAMFIFLAGFMAITFLSMTGMFLMQANYPPLNGGLLASKGMRFALLPTGLGSMAIGWVAYAYFRNQPEGHRIFFMSALLIPLQLFFLFMVGFMWTNGAWDESTAQNHTTHVVDKQVVKGKNTSYRIIVGSWHDPDKVIKVRVSPNDYKAFQVDDTLTLTTRAGYHGVEWLVSPPRRKIGAQ